MIATDASPSRSQLFGRIRRNPSLVAGATLLLVIIAAAVLAPLLYPGDPLSMVARPLLWPGQDLGYPLG
ncbi:hypothetical protein ACSTHL_23260, partial [Vibrio parahaemolyticus]